MIYTNEYYTTTSSVYLSEFITSMETCRRVTSDFVSLISKSERLIYSVGNILPYRVKTITVGNAYQSVKNDKMVVYRIVNLKCSRQISCNPDLFFGMTCAAVSRSLRVLLELSTYFGGAQEMDN
jgi:hypothetical protein